MKMTSMLTPLISISTRSFRAIAVVFPLLAGCNMDDPFMQEMEVAYATASQGGKTSSLDRQEAITRVVQRYFPQGMQIKVALDKLHGSGFDISEYRYEGSRSWPDGQMKPWDELRKNNIQSRYRINQVNYIASRKFGFILKIPATKEARIIIESDGERIIQSSGNIFLHGI